MNKILDKHCYLAPDLEVFCTNSADILCLSYYIYIDGNPFEENADEQW